LRKSFRESFRFNASLIWFWVKGKLYFKNCSARANTSRTGGVLALGLGSKGWSAKDCEKNLVQLLKRSFAAEANRRLPSISLRRRRYGLWKYHSRPLEDCLKDTFTEYQHLGYKRSKELYSDYGAYAAVHAHSVGGYPAVFTNYPSRKTHFDLKLWEM
jgi:hypothetical protein